MTVCLLLPVPQWLCWTLIALLAIVLCWVLSFFRDPHRDIPAGDHLLISPADGTVQDIEMVDETSYIGGKALRIGIFLSIFNVHINRCPCNAKVEKVLYKRGRFLDARDPQATKINESNDIHLLRADSPVERLLVRQISGAIARRIVCQAKPGLHLAAGEQFGMIKFGSRTELYLPCDSEAQILVKPGDKVRAGATILAQYPTVSELTDTAESSTAVQMRK